MTLMIDLICYSNELHPASYHKDLLAILDKVLGHDDKDSDRTKGQELDGGFLRLPSNGRIHLVQGIRGQEPCTETLLLLSA